MLEKYLVNSDVIGRIRASWIAEPIEIYVKWLEEWRYGKSTVRRRIFLLENFGEFTKQKGVKKWSSLGKYVDSFAAKLATEREYFPEMMEARAKENTGPILQMLRLLSGCNSPGIKRGERKRKIPKPSFDYAPGFLMYLRQERGLAATTIRNYEHWLGRFEQFLIGQGGKTLENLTPEIIRKFIENVCHLQPRSTNVDACGCLRVFLRYLYRQEVIRRDLSILVESPRMYALSDIPRSVSWSDVKTVLNAVDRKTATGQRDYAILMLLSVYGLRAREVASLCLEDVDWKHDRIRVPNRKAGNSSAYPLSELVGNAILDYLRNSRPKTTYRNIFIRDMAPRLPVSAAVVSRIAAKYCRLAKVVVARPGSHTLRHSCAQHLLECDFSIKAIGDYLGHKSQQSTRIYTKVNLGSLRQLALSDGEELI